MKPMQRFFAVLVAASIFLLTPSSSLPYSGFSISQVVYMKCILSENRVPDWIGRDPTIQEITGSGTN